MKLVIKCDKKRYEQLKRSKVSGLTYSQRKIARGVPLDEVVSSLDVLSRDTVEKLICQIKCDGKCLCKGNKQNCPAMIKLSCTPSE